MGTRIIDGGNRQSLKLHTALALLLLVEIVPTAVADESANPRQSIPLNGAWQFQRDTAPTNEWKAVMVPSTFQEHEGNEFHGVGWYRREVAPFDLPTGRRVLLHFDAAATLAELWWNGERLGTHLGGWTPFRFDVTELVRKAPAGKPHEIRVRLDEKAGHNTQGFLTIIEPHFGGIWQDVKLLVVPEVYIDELSLHTYGNPRSRRLELEIALSGSTNAKVDSLLLRRRPLSVTAWQSETNLIWIGGYNARFEVPCPDAQLWSIASPNLVDLEIDLRADGKVLDRVPARAAFRDAQARGDHFSLNGVPVSVRGVLNWGYYPPHLAPHPDEARFRRDIEFARERGFNLMKFCLWIPPKRFLELCDEMGMLAWMEYPTWHPQLTPTHLPDLRREFVEFFHYDRNHPSVFLRSLTCETGSGADLGVIQDLYDLAHREIPGAIVEDDSSWIGWNRVHDFYDDHPYGNNDTWVETLAGFRDYILAHGPKPLALGECIAADTWFNRQPILDRVGTNRPYWVPGFFDAMGEWETKMERLNGRGGLNQLVPESLHYAMLMRKFQAEAFRREMPYGGYVISVIRDFPTAAMGLIDYHDHPKWSPAEWAWQGDTMLLMQTEHDRRSFFAGEPFRGEILLSHFGAQKLPAGELTVSVSEDGANGKVLHEARKKIAAQNSGTLTRPLKLDFKLPSTKSPVRLVNSVRLTTPSQTNENSWPIWIVPRPTEGWPQKVWLHPSLSDALARELFPGVKRVAQPQPGQVAVAAQFDDALIQFIEQGGRALLLPDGRRGSLPLNAHWFLRGAPYVPDHPLAKRAPRAFWIDLQHFDLASSVVPEIKYLAEIDPVLMLWDNHDLKTVKTHGLLFETRAGQGRLLVSALQHDESWNAAGPAPRHTLSDSTWRRVKEKLHEDKIDLTKKT